jgi:hypothetical protein
MGLEGEPHRKRSEENRAGSQHAQNPDQRGDAAWFTAQVQHVRPLDATSAPGRARCARRAWVLSRASVRAGVRAGGLTFCLLVCACAGARDSVSVTVTERVASTPRACEDEGEREIGRPHRFAV